MAVERSFRRSFQDKRRHTARRLNNHNQCWTNRHWGNIWLVHESYVTKTTTTAEKKRKKEIPFVNIVNKTLIFSILPTTLSTRFDKRSLLALFWNCFQKPNQTERLEITCWHHKDLLEQKDWIRPQRCWRLTGSLLQSEVLWSQSLEAIRGFKAVTLFHVWLFLMTPSVFYMPSMGRNNSQRIYEMDDPQHNKLQNNLDLNHF